MFRETLSSPRKREREKIALTTILDSSPSDSPVGVFDSGLGGLSVLRHIRALLPGEDLLYFADSGYAPYGGRPEHEIVERSLAVAGFFLDQGAKAIVVACNTATAASIRALREKYPALPLVGVEPGLKPAATATRTKVVGVLATQRTLASAKFAALRDEIATATGVRFIAQPCVGLADQIDKGELQSAETARLVHRYVEPVLQDGADTLVLGCTHYPFVRPMIEDIVASSGRQVTIIDTGEAVARQLARLLDQNGLQRTQDGAGALRAFTTGSASTLATAFERQLHLRPAIAAVAGRAAGECTN
jgi:glutamate racemase